MSILSDDIMDIEEATANWEVSPFNGWFLRPALRKHIPFPEHVIKAHLDVIPIIELTDKKIIEACATVIAPEYQKQFRLQFDENKMVWLYSYRPTKYSTPSGFFLKTYVNTQH